MFADITTGSAGEALDANPWAPLTLVHVHASDSPDIGWVINHLDEPALPHADFSERTASRSW
ncbi:hypothetical protein [Streptomyces sp. SID3343]|uniref:hypothetical protein n=1 Tax=Streptomyces sp. SID3343 TaxID=2690260 RepID=UPI00137103C0|nr:hypothetical protein [Streptomyces sp. SID3343]MYW06204.1 hypothetical protein [Streptomyces sp. SID3343]